MNPPKARIKSIIIQETDKELLIYDLVTNRALHLNESSAIVWQLCDGKTSAAELSRKVSQKLNKSIGEDFVWLALNELTKNALIENSHEILEEFEGLSRRELVKRVGFASMAALPVVTSIIAPRATHAQSISSGALLSSCPSQNGPGCATGLTCKQCGDDIGDNATPCTGVFHCCSPSNQIGLGTPGYEEGTCVTDVADCGIFNWCCSGTGTIAPSNNCAPGTLACVCT